MESEVVRAKRLQEMAKEVYAKWKAKCKTEESVEEKLNHVTTEKETHATFDDLRGVL